MSPPPLSLSLSPQQFALSFFLLLICHLLFFPWGIKSSLPILKKSQLCIYVKIFSVHIRHLCFLCFVFNIPLLNARLRVPGHHMLLWLSIFCFLFAYLVFVCDRYYTNTRLLFLVAFMTLLEKWGCFLAPYIPFNIFNGFVNLLLTFVGFGCIVVCFLSPSLFDVFHC